MLLDILLVGLFCFAGPKKKKLVLNNGLDGVKDYIDWLRSSAK